MELRKVGRTEMEESIWTKSSRSLETKAFTPGNLHQKSLGSLEGRRIKARISRTRNNLWRGYNLHNHGFPKIIEIENE